MNKTVGKIGARGRPERNVWPKALPLFPPLTPLAVQALEKLPFALEKVWPLNATHRASLPADIADLSRLLTSERHRLRHSYWEKPNYISAYLYYFFPWNIIRQCRLLQGLSLPPLVESSCLVDIGAGPMAFLIALWLAKPKLHSASLNILALDKSRRPMELGRSIYKALGEIMDIATWNVNLAKKSHGDITEIGSSITGKPWLISAANFLNEYLFAHARRASRRFSSFGNDEDGGDENTPLLEMYFNGIEQFMQNGAAFLAIEPGTRMGGESIMRLRELALEKGFYVQAPCTHQNICPLMERNRTQPRAPHTSCGSAWCHFTFDAGGAPAWLMDLSRMAGLEKNSLSLSPLLLCDTHPKMDKSESFVECRVLSKPFAVPGLSDKCRYGCEKNGLALLPDAQGLYEGFLLPVYSSGHGKVDKKSGAKIVWPPK